VTWKGYENKHNTWEPIENLVGCEDMIAEFKEREATRLAQIEVAAAKAAEDAAAARVAAKAAAEAKGGDVAVAVAAAEAATAASGELAKNNSGGGTKRTCWVWGCFDETGCEKGKAACKLLKPTGEICEECIRPVDRPR
jgi:hypothetical protein